MIKLSLFCYLNLIYIQILKSLYINKQIWRCRPHRKRIWIAIWRCREWGGPQLVLGLRDRLGSCNQPYRSFRTKQYREGCNLTGQWTTCSKARSHHRRRQKQKRQKIWKRQRRKMKPWTSRRSYLITGKESRPTRSIDNNTYTRWTSYASRRRLHTKLSGSFKSASRREQSSSKPFSTVRHSWARSAVPSMKWPPARTNWQSSKAPTRRRYCHC